MKRYLAGMAAAFMAVSVTYAAAQTPQDTAFIDDIVSAQTSLAQAMIGACRNHPTHPKCPTTTTLAPTTTQAPTTTVAPTTTAAPTTTQAPTTTAAPTTTVAPTTTLPTPTTTFGPTTTTLQQTCTGVQVASTQSIQTAVTNNPGTTTFCLAAGTFHNQTVTPKSGNTFVGVLGATGQRLTILDGDNTAQFSIYVGTGSVTGVTIRNVIVEDYNTVLQRAALGGYGLTNSLIDNVESRYNNAGGVSFGTGTRVANSFIHHNEQTGMYANGATNGVVENNEISWNNYLALHDPMWEAGGSKFLYTTNLILRNNFVHDNRGPGLWTDVNNFNTLVENNRTINNFGPGIFHEISYDAVIRNNYVEGNGFGYPAWLDGSGILVNSSPNVEIYGNTVVNNNDGIGVTFTNRGSGQRGAWEPRNLNVHDNTITQPTGRAAGIVTNVTGTGVFTTWNNRFENNTYDVPNPTTGAYWEWAGGAGRTWTQWRSYGHDDTGSVS